MWKPRKGGGRQLCIFLQETYSYKFWNDLLVSSTAFKCLCVEVENKNSKNIVLNLVYRPPNGDHRELENYFKSSVSKQEISHKDIILARDFNINLLEQKRSKFCKSCVSFWNDSNKSVGNFENVKLLFRRNVKPLFRRNKRIWRKGLVCKSSSVGPNELIWQPGDITKEFW